MRIAVILTAFLKEYVASYFRSHSFDCELSYFTYRDFAHAGDLYLELSEGYDGFLVSGPVPRAAICRRVPVLSRPIVSFGSNALCYYETFFQVQFKEQDFYLERGYFDLLEWMPDAKPLSSYLKDGEFNRVIYQIYQSTSSYTLEQLCEKEERIKAKHLRLWQEGKISYSVTRFSNIMPDLLNAGVKTYFVYPKYEILQESITMLLQEIHLKTMLQNQSALSTFSQQLSDGASVVSPQFLEAAKKPAKESGQLLRLSQKTGLSVSYVKRLLSALASLDQEYVTARSLACALSITPRSANRLLTRLLASQTAEEVTGHPSFSPGRPERLYRILLEAE